MTDNEVIAILARELCMERAKTKVLAESISSAQGHLICIGGPLNDNVLGFNKEQRALLHKIDDCLRSGLVDSEAAA